MLSTLALQGIKGEKNETKRLNCFSQSPNLECFQGYQKTLQIPQTTWNPLPQVT